MSTRQYAKSLAMAPTPTADGTIDIPQLVDAMDRLVASSTGAFQLERNPFK
jgi:hypothetical protein